MSVASERLVACKPKDWNLPTASVDCPTWIPSWLDPWDFSHHFLILKGSPLATPSTASTTTDTPSLQSYLDDSCPFGGGSVDLRALDFCCDTVSTPSTPVMADSSRPGQPASSNAGLENSRGGQSQGLTSGSSFETLDPSPSVGFYSQIPYPLNVPTEMQHPATEFPWDWSGGYEGNFVDFPATNTAHLCGARPETNSLNPGC